MEQHFAELSIHDDSHDHVVAIPSAWAKAHAEFAQDLTTAEQVVYHKASIETIIDDMEHAGARLEASISKRALDKIVPFVETIQGFGSALDVLSNICPLVMAPLWGGIRVMLHLAYNCGSYWRNIVELISQINEVLPRSAIYATLFGHHTRVITAVTTTFLDVLHFCKDVKTILRQGTIFRLKFWASFERNFKISDFRKHNEKVLLEVELAHQIDAQQFHKTITTNQNTSKTQSTEDRKWHNQRAQQSFLESLHTCDYESHKNMVPGHVLGTCEWLLRHRSFWKWWQGHLCLLFVGLGPAMGKSVLARTIVDFLSSTDLVHIPEAKYDKTVCYFFFSDDDSRCDARGAISALLHQLFCDQPKLLDTAFETNKQVFNQHSFGALWNTFVKLLRGEQHINIVWVLDGLDHCEESSRLELLEKLNSLFRGSLERSRLKVIITSRYLSSIHDILDESPSSKYCKLLGQSKSDQQHIQTEINLFIQARLNRFQRLRQKRINAIDDVSNDLGHSISSKANHNYLWVSFIFETLDKNAGLSRQDMKDIVESLPKSCSDFYERTLSRCSHPQKTRTLLHAVVGAARPLTIYEMNYVLCLQKEQRSLADVDLVPQFNLAKTLQELCGFFINVVDDRIHLMHQTAKEFLLEDASAHYLHRAPEVWMHSLQAGTSHAIMAQACLRFLQFKSSDSQQPVFDEKFLSRDSNFNLHAPWIEEHAKDSDIIKEYSKKHPFLQYAACHWHFHLEKSDPDNAAATLMSIDSQICDPNSNIWKTWFGVFIKNWQGFGTIPPFTRRLHFASWFGYAQEVEHLLRQKECTVDEKLFALTAAVQTGRRNITKLLIDHDMPELRRWRTLAQRSEDIIKVLKRVQAAFPDDGLEFCEFTNSCSCKCCVKRKQQVEEMELDWDKDAQ